MRYIAIAVLLAALPYAKADESRTKRNFVPKSVGCTFETFMRTFVHQEKDAPSVNSFFVSENFGHPEDEYWVYWPQKRVLLLVGWPNKACNNPSLVIRRRLDLSKDVVKTEADVGTSTYLVTEDWAKAILFDAARSGYQVTIRK